MAILDLKQGWMGVKIAKVAIGHGGVPLCNNEKWYDGGLRSILLLIFQMISRKENAHHVSNKLFIYSIHFLCLSNVISNPKWQLLDKDV